MVFLHGQRPFILTSLAMASQATEGSGGSPGDLGFVLPSSNSDFGFLRKTVPLFLLSINLRPFHIASELARVSLCSWHQWYFYLCLMLYIAYFPVPQHPQCEFLNYLCEQVFCLHVCAPFVSLVSLEARRRPWTPWNWSFSACALNGFAISPVPPSVGFSQRICSVSLLGNNFSTTRERIMDGK